MATQERLIIESMFRIADKQQNDADFLLNREQAILDANLTGRDIVPKARQLGISSYFLARYLAACLFKRNTRAVVISHDMESTQKMLQKVHYMIEHMKGAKPVLKNASKNELTFPKTDSAFYIGTAGSRKFGRGDTITHLHGSEVAFWENPKDLLGGLYQAVVPHGEIALESTGNGKGNYYHRACVRAAEGSGRFRCHFFNWLANPEYRLPLNPDEREFFLQTLRDDIEEPKYLDMGLTLEQLAWRRYKIMEELDGDLRTFKQEYPVILEECFQATGGGVFSVLSDYKPLQDWRRLDKNLFGLHDHYDNAHSSYLLSVDVGGGVGKDNSVIEVLDILHDEQVAEWCSNEIDPRDLAYVIKDLAEHYKNAYVAVESNNHGLTTLSTLTDIYPLYLIHQDETAKENILGYGVRTTARTKPLFIGALKSALKNGFIMHSELLKDELDTFIETDSGKLEAAEGSKDDRVMAMAIGMHVMPHAQLLVEDYRHNYNSHNFPVSITDPFSLEALIEERTKAYDEKNSGSFPIADQVYLEDKHEDLSTVDEWLANRPE